MQNKLQELTEKLYQEGLVKGKAEGEEILAGARKEAAAIIEKAKAEAASIIAKAEKDASDLKAKVDSDMKMASAQCLQATKKDIENLLVGKIEAGKVSDTLKDSAFVKEIIKAVAGKFNAEEATGLALVLPEGMKAELSQSAVQVKATGAYTKMNQLDGGQLLASVDASGLSEGIYDLPVAVSADNFPDVAFEAEPQVIRVTIRAAE